MIWVLWIVLAALAVFLTTVLVRGAMFRPLPEEKTEPSEANVDAQKAIDDLAAMIRCKTVSYRDASLIDEGEFDKFRALLTERFPNVTKACSFERIGKSGLLYKLSGKSSAEPSVFMAHYDVVPVNESLWEKPAFDGIIEDGVLWGRGTLDTKGTLCGVMEAAEHLIGSGFTPENDMYFAFAGDEEIAGDTAPSMVEVFRSRGIRPALVVDEGGAVVEGVFPGVTESCALIGIAEKGMMEMELAIEGAGGHASAPPPHTPVGKLALAVAAVEAHPFKRRLTKPVAEMFDTLGRRSSFLYRVIFANLWCFLPLLDTLCKKSGGELNAMMRTTCAFTMMQGSKASNVIPPNASVSANLRLAGGDTEESALAYVRSLIQDGDVQVRETYGMAPSPNSSTDSAGWKKLKRAVSETWPGALVSPYLMVACSDSRHYCAISDNVYRFSAMALSKEERGYIHGNNERIPVDKIVRTAQFYVRLMRQC